jgi:uncharacterized membrane protein
MSVEGRCADDAVSGMGMLVGYVLLAGVVTSLALVGVGVVWHWAATGDPRLDYALPGTNVVQLLVADAQQLVAGAVRPRLLINVGLAVLMLTPYLRVLASALYFAVVERNAKYTLFTGFVLAVLTVSLFG